MKLKKNKIDIKTSWFNFLSSLGLIINYVRVVLWLNWLGWFKNNLDDKYNKFEDEIEK
jgi:hypothetical protein